MSEFSLVEGLKNKPNAVILENGELVSREDYDSTVEKMRGVVNKNPLFLHDLYVICKDPGKYQLIKVIFEESAKTLLDFNLIDETGAIDDKIRKIVLNTVRYDKNNPALATLIV